MRYFKNEVSPMLKNKIQKKHLYLFETPEQEEEDKCDFQTFSIDPNGCLDIDDAFHIKLLDDNNYERFI